MNRTKLLVPLALGTVLPLAGCSEGVPPPSEGAWLVDFKAGTHGSACTIASTQPVYVGDMSRPECAGRTAPVDQGQHCGLAMDGYNGVRTYCAVQQQGASFHLEAVARQGANFLQFQVDGITAAANDTAPARGRVTFTSEQVVETYTSPDAELCEFYFNDAQRSQLAPGRVWGTFRCTTLLGSASTPSQCAIQPSFFAFQNCDE